MSRPSSASGPAPGGWFVVVPVKSLSTAKTRLALPPPLRVRVARAMALDTIAAAAECSLVAGVVVVTDEELDFRGLRVRIVPDTPRAGLNAALRHGAEIALQLATSYFIEGTGVAGSGFEGVPSAGIAALLADLPALQPAELTAVLRAVPGDRRVVVSDAAGSGTTLLAAAAGQPLQPAFGSRSHRNHLDSGALDASSLGGPGLRRDVDTVADLSAAMPLRLGRHTSALLPELPV